VALGATRRKAGGVSDIEGVGSCSVPVGLSHVRACEILEALATSAIQGGSWRAGKFNERQYMAIQRAGTSKPIEDWHALELQSLLVEDMRTASHLHMVLSQSERDAIHVILGEWYAAQRD